LKKTLDEKSHHLQNSMNDRARKEKRKIKYRDDGQIFTYKEFS
jgi:hypothetical protein